MKHSRDIEIKRLKSMLAHAIEEKEHAEQALRELGVLPDKWEKLNTEMAGALEKATDEDLAKIATPTPSTGEGIYKLVEYLSKHGGSIVSSNDLHPDLINQAMASNRMWVDDNSLGYVWEPPIAGKFPETPEDVEMFEWCYPIPVELKKEDSERMLKNILNGTRQPATPTPEYGYVNIIDCPNCGEKWDTGKHNACQCGAQLIGEPFRNSNKQTTPEVVPEDGTK